jgi:hypothetical protein
MCQTTGCNPGCERGLHVDAAQRDGDALVMQCVDEPPR